MPNDNADAMTDPWTDRLSEYVDGELDAPTRQALEAHLTTCATCRATCDALERVVARARRVRYHEPAQDLWSAIERTIGEESPPRRRPRLVTVPLSRLVLAAGLVAV